MDGTYTGVLDRVVDGETAVFLLEADGEVCEEVTMPVEDVPPDVRDAGEGAVCAVTLADGAVEDLTFRADETRDRLERNRDRFDRLSTRLGEDS